MVLAFMAYQDFKFRGISWWLFPLLFFGLLIYCNMLTGWHSVYSSVTLNAVFLLSQVVFLTLYISLKEGRLTNIFNGFFGLGDLLFLCCATCCFSVSNYIVFYIIGLFLTIAVTLAFKFFRSQVKDKIPLAGYQAILLIVVMLADRVQDGWHMFSDVMLLDFTGF